MNENVIEWLRGQDTVALTLCSNSRLAGKIKRLYETHQDVMTLHENPDGSIFAHVPLKWIKIGPPRKVSEEQRAAASQRLKEYQQNKRQ